MQRNLLLLFVVIALVTGAYFLNNSLNTLAPPDDRARAQMAREQAANSTPASPAPKSSTTSSKDETLPSELTVGNPKTARTIVTLGYTIDDTLALDSTNAVHVVDAAKQWAMGKSDASLQVVCVDVPADERNNPGTANIPLGLVVNGKPVRGLNTNPGEGDFSAETLSSVLVGYH